MAITKASTSNVLNKQKFNTTFRANNSVATLNTPPTVEYLIVAGGGGGNSDMAGGGHGGGRHWGDSRSRHQLVPHPGDRLPHIA